MRFDDRTTAVVRLCTGGLVGVLLVLSGCTETAGDETSTDDSAALSSGRCSGVAARERRSLEIMTINVRRDGDDWMRRFPLLADEIARLNPDVIGLQEVMITLGQAVALAELVALRGGPRYHVSQHYKPGFVGFVLGEGVAVLSRWPIVESRSIDLGLRRVAQLARIELPSGARIDVLNAHFENGSGADKDAVRLDQAELSLRFAEEQDQCNVTFFTGDFNTTATSPAIRRLLFGGFSDSYEAVHGASTSPTGNTCPVVLREGAFAQQPEVRIDFVLRKRAGARTARPRDSIVAFKNHDAAGFYPSDHFGVMTTFDGEL